MSVIYSSIPYFFFFSSRRRHTRFSRDWSSDVCSSDLDDTDHRYDKLGIVAPPKFLGQLRQHLPRGVEKLVAVTSAKDVAWLDARSIAEYLGENLDSK